MSTIDKVNSELERLKTDLSSLNTYTDEIGKAKDASQKVISLIEEFTKTFHNRVNAITANMNDASSGFQENCQAVEADFTKASAAFKKGITESQRSLQEIETNLTIASKQVNDLTTRIDRMDILGQFAKIHERQHEQIRDSATNLQQQLAAAKSLEGLSTREFSAMRKRQIVIIILAVLLLFATIAFHFLK